MRRAIELNDRHVFILVVLTGVLLGIGYAASQSVGTVWHPLSQVLTSTGASVDASPADGTIDRADAAESATTASSVPCTGITGTSDSGFCQNRLGSFDRSATTGQSCDRACQANGETCTNAWKSDTNLPTSCTDTAAARNCTCLFRF